MTTGGFSGDLAEAFTPPAMGGCCGSAAPASASVSAQPAQAQTAAPCCGSTAEAQASGDCCGTEAKAEAVASGAGCCG